jgi:hypothetical protein
MLGSRKVIVKARLPVHELAEFDYLAAGAGLSRSRLVNIALGALLDSEDVRDPSLWRKRRVRFLLDDSTYARLRDAAQQTQGTLIDLDSGLEVSLIVQIIQIT